MSDPFAMFTPLPRPAADSPDDDDVRELVQLFIRAAGKKRPVAVADDKRRKVRHESDTRVANDSLPSSSESVSSWLTRFPVQVDVNRGPRKALFDALRNFSIRFGERRFADLATSDRNALAAFVNRIEAV